MMYSYPFFRNPFFPSRYPRSPLVYRSVPKEPPRLSPPIEKTPSSNSQEAKKEENRSSEDKPVFEIFGISLYFDDLLLLGLLFFLYSEGVQDQELFISLILLLLS